MGVGESADSKIEKLLGLAKQYNFAELLMDLLSRVNIENLDVEAMRGNPLFLGKVVLAFSEENYKSLWSADFYDTIYNRIQFVTGRKGELIVEQILEGYYFIKLHCKNGKWQCAAIVPDRENISSIIIYSDE